MTSSLAPLAFTLHLPSPSFHASKLGILRRHALIFVSADSSHPRHRLSGQINRAPPVRSVALRTEPLSNMQLDATEDEEKFREVIDVGEKSKPKTTLAEIWREIQGANDWENLLDPMDDILRKEITKYGEFAQACYDAFDFDPFSKYCGGCKYNRRELLEGVGMSDSGYQVTKYLYATSKINLPGVFQKARVQKQWSTHANWMGFIAVATDENEIRRLGRRDIVVAWRGTVTYLEWIADLMDYLRPTGMNHVHPQSELRLEPGFLNLYTARDHDCKYCKSSARDQVLSELGRLLGKYRGEQLSITMTGHGLGSALAMLSSYDVAEMGLGQSESIPITVFSFAGPRVGNAVFKERCEELGLKFLRMVNVHDIVPKVPGILFNEKFHVMKKWVDKFPWSYHHVGLELALNHSHSPFLKSRQGTELLKSWILIMTKVIDNLSCFHNLEAYLHLLDGYHGPEKDFHLSSGRDHALVNKSSDFLKDHYLIPPYWWQDANKGLIKNSKGRWVRTERNRITQETMDTDHHEETMDTNTERMDTNIVG